VLFGPRQLQGAALPHDRRLKAHGFREKITIPSNKLQCALKMYKRGVRRLADRRLQKQGDIGRAASGAVFEPGIGIGLAEKTTGWWLQASLGLRRREHSSAPLRCIPILH
jgi:hypothetical protein